MSLPDFSKFQFTEEALELFKLIWLSCVYSEKVLKSCVDFLKLTYPKTLADTYKYIKTGSCTIGCYKSFSKSTKKITKKDVIMAFADDMHIEAMKELYIYGSQTDFWHENFELEGYLISHVVKPTIINPINICQMRFISNCYHNKLSLGNLYCPFKFDDRLIHLVHFGVIVDSLDYTKVENKKILNELLDLQDGVFDDFDQFIENKKINIIDYKFLTEIYQRNYDFYNSLRT